MDDSERRTEAVKAAAACFEACVEFCEAYGIEWWVRQGWSLRKLGQLELKEQEAYEQARPMGDRQEGGEDVGRSRQELRGGGGDAVPREQLEGRVKAFVREALARKPKGSARRRRRRR